MSKLEETFDPSILRFGDVILEHVDLKLFNQITWLARLINFFQMNQWSHCKIVSEKFGKLTIVEANQGGVEQDLFVAGNLYNSRIKVIRPKLYNPLLLPSDIEDKKHKIDFLIGKPYDFGGCLFFQLVKQLGEMIDDDIDIWIGERGVKATKRFYCSKVVSYVYREIFPSWEDVAPDDIDKAIDIHFDVIWDGYVKYIK